MTRVKICGLRRPEDADSANRCLPEYVGFVFAPSKRRVDASTARRLRERLDPRIGCVGVFVNEQVETVARLCGEGIIDLVQLHGDEDGEYRRRLRALTPAPIIQAVPVRDRLPEALPAGAEYLLFDTAAGTRGGSGRAFDWRVLAGYTGAPYFLAGGLSPENITRALEVARPCCVDVSSGVESGGYKDPAKMQRFVELVRGAK